MSTLIFSNSSSMMSAFFEANTSLGSTPSTNQTGPTIVFGGQTATGGVTSGSGAAGAFMYIYKGTVPTSFESFNGNLASRNSDLLLILPKLGNNIVQNSSTGTRYLVSRSNLAPNYSYGSIGNPVTFSANRVNNVVTTSIAFSSAVAPFIASLAPNLAITTANAADATFNGNFVLTSAGSNSTHYFATWNNPGANANTSLNIEYKPIGIANGTATWFCLKAIGTQVISGSINPPAIDANLLSPNSSVAVIGNIGVTGSGSDLEMNSTSIVANARYSSLGFYINFPYTWDIT